MPNEPSAKFARVSRCSVRRSESPKENFRINHTCSDDYEKRIIRCTTSHSKKPRWLYSLSRPAIANNANTSIIRRSWRPSAKKAISSGA